MLGFRRRLVVRGALFVALFVVRLVFGQKCPCVGNGQEPVPCEAAFAAAGKCIQDDHTGTIYPADYGTRCAAHKEVGQADCFSRATGREFPTVCREGQTPRADGCAMKWCYEKWCYVDPEACPGVLDPKKLWRRKALVFSYENCEEVAGGEGAEARAPAVASQPAPAQGTAMTTTGPPEAGLDQTQDETDVQGLEGAREKEEEEDGSNRAITGSAANLGFPMLVVLVGLGLLCLFCFGLLAVRRKARWHAGLGGSSRITHGPVATCQV